LGSLCRPQRRRALPICVPDQPDQCASYATDRSANRAAESSAHCGTVDASGERALGRAVEIFVEPFESTADLIEYKPLADATEPIAEPLGVDAGGLERVADIAD